MKSVAVIGAGPSGLVSAKICLLMYPEQFKVTLFEKRNRVGGLWAVNEEDQSETLNPQMPTNLSKYTVSFSDLSWESVNLSSGDDKRQQPRHKAPEFPKAWMVGKYLEQYREKYIPIDALRLNACVTKVSSVSPNSQENTPQWKVEYCKVGSKNLDANSESKEEVFDYVIVANGFLGNPIRKFAQTFPYEELRQYSTAKVIHSSQFRTLADLIPETWNGANDVLVYGGSMSGVEVAAALAYQLSNRKYSPSASNSFGSPKVYHVTSRPFYVFSPFASTNTTENAPAYLPLDLVFFELSRRPVESASANIGRVPADKAKQTHGFFRTQVGSDQGDLDAPAIYASSTSDPPYITNATGASYLEFVRSGLIVPVEGRVEKLDTSNKSSDGLQLLIARVATTDDRTEIENLAGAVEATGFETNLTFLSDHIKEKLDHKSEMNRLPLMLSNQQTSSQKISTIAFVGIHEGSYWGTEECQARVIIQSWVNKLRTTNQAGKIEEDPSTLKDLREGIANKSSDIPQLLYGDYVGIMEQTAIQGFATRDDEIWGGRTGPAVPARYIDSSTDLKEAHLTIKDLKQTIEKASTDGLYVVRAAFLGFQGTWAMNREIRSALNSSPSGTFIGTAKFHPRNATDNKFDSEYLYIEDGDFNTDQGFSMKASRRYVYRFEKDTDQLTTWFVKLDGKTVDYLFLNLEIQSKTKMARRDDYWTATAHHPCDPDSYDAKYTFQFNGMTLDKFIVEYRVIGPRKDYTSTTIYKRLVKSS